MDCKNKKQQKAKIKKLHKAGKKPESKRESKKRRILKNLVEKISSKKPKWRKSKIRKPRIQKWILGLRPKAPSLALASKRI